MLGSTLRLGSTLMLAKVRIGNKRFTNGLA